MRGLYCLFTGCLTCSIVFQLSDYRSAFLRTGMRTMFQAHPWRLKVSVSLYLDDVVLCVVFRGVVLIAYVIATPRPILASRSGCRCERHECTAAGSCGSPTVHSNAGAVSALRLLSSPGHIIHNPQLLCNVSSGASVATLGAPVAERRLNSHSEIRHPHLAL